MSSTVFYSPFNGFLNDNPPGTIITGVPGRGKTYLLLNIAANALYTNSRVIFIDFKNDSRNLKYVDPNINMIDINEIEDGALNPFRLINNVDTNTIMSIIEILVGEISGEKITAISPIVRDFVLKNERSSQEVNFSQLANYLYASANTNAQEIGTILKMNEDSRYGRLLFGKYVGKNKDQLSSFGDNESMVISLLGMSFPSATTSKKEMSHDERFTSAIVYIITRILMDTLSRDKSVPTALIIDEAHVAYMSEPISRVINSFLTLGRSLKVATVLASQNTSHFPENIGQFMSYKFTFKLSRQEAEMFVDKFDLTGLSSEDSYDSPIDVSSVISGIMDLKKGECFMIDSKNRVGFLKVYSNMGTGKDNPLHK